MTYFIGKIVNFLTKKRCTREYQFLRRGYRFGGKFFYLLFDLNHNVGQKPVQHSMFGSDFVYN